MRGNIKRQHLANPNLKFVTFKQFKKNIIDNYNMKRSNSAKGFRPIANSRNDEFYYDKINNSSYKIGMEYNRSYKNIMMTRNKKFNNNNNSFNSTGHTSKMGRTMSRCQSAFSIRNKNNHF